MRKEMEAIYMLVFKFNLLLSDDDINAGQFKNVTSQMQFQNRLAEEFMERDLLEHFLTEDIYIRYTFWQVIMILWAMWLHKVDLTLGTDIYPGKGNHYCELCKDEYPSLKESANAESKDALGELLTKKSTIDWSPDDPSDITPVLDAFLYLHIIDCLFYIFTKKGWDMWKVIKPEDKEVLENDEKKHWSGLSRLHAAWA